MFNVTAALAFPFAINASARCACRGRAAHNFAQFAGVNGTATTHARTIRRRFQNRGVTNGNAIDISKSFSIPRNFPVCEARNYPASFAKSKTRRISRLDKKRAEQPLSAGQGRGRKLAKAARPEAAVLTAACLA